MKLTPKFDWMQAEINNLIRRGGVYYLFGYETGVINGYLANNGFEVINDIPNKKFNNFIDDFINSNIRTIQQSCEFGSHNYTNDELTKDWKLSIIKLQIKHLNLLNKILPDEAEFKNFKNTDKFLFVNWYDFQPPSRDKQSIEWMQKYFLPHYAINENQKQFNILYAVDSLFRLL